jgi:hypothetical protein
VKGIKSMSSSENRSYRKTRKAALASGRIRGKSKGNRKCQAGIVQDMCVEAMGDILDGKLSIKESNSAARHAGTFARICEVSIKCRTLEERRDRRRRALERIEELRSKAESTCCHCPLL